MYYSFWLCKQQTRETYSTSNDHFLINTINFPMSLNINHNQMSSQNIQSFAKLSWKKDCLINKNMTTNQRPGNHYKDTWLADFFSQCHHCNFARKSDKKGPFFSTILPVSLKSEKTTKECSDEGRSEWIKNMFWQRFASFIYILSRQRKKTAFY